MTVVLDERIAEKVELLVPLLVAADIKCETKYKPIIENSITFRRELAHRAMDENLQVNKN
jgi:hypothetical protein